MQRKITELARLTQAKTKAMTKLSMVTVGASLLSFVGALATAQKAVEAQESKPNLVMFIADDMGYADMGAYGSEINTPVMDSMAQNGVMFTNFRTGSECSPSRSMMLTGVDNHRAGLGQMLEKLYPNQEGKPNYEGVINDRVVTMPTVLQDAGYNTYWVGKWHLGGAEEGHGRPPHELGFGRTFGMLEGGGDHYTVRAFAPGVADSHYIYDGEPTELPDDFFTSKSFTDAMIDFVNEGQDSGNPFFAFMAYMAPHVPLQLPDKDLVKKYEEIYAAGWDEIRAQRFERQQELGIIPGYLELPPRWPGVTAWDTLTPEQQRIEAKKMALYAAMIEDLDREMGRFMDHLKDIGEYDNTIFLFITDNGADGHDRASSARYQQWFKDVGISTAYEDMGQGNSFVTRGLNWTQVSATPFWGQKASVTEGGIRGEFTLFAPGLIDSGTRTAAFASVMDIMPTFLDYAGVEHPGDTYNGQPIHPMMGRSMRPLLEGTAEAIYAPDEPIGFETGGDVNDALFMGDWKLLRIAPSEGEEWGDSTWKLFNLTMDPRELHDLSDMYPELCNQMVEHYKQYLTDMGYVPGNPPEGSLETMRSCTED
jgi:arylsulfatase A-like enzyme